MVPSSDPGVVSRSGKVRPNPLVTSEMDSKAGTGARQTKLATNPAHVRTQVFEGQLLPTAGHTLPGQRRQRRPRRDWGENDDGEDLAAMAPAERRYTAKEATTGPKAKQMWKRCFSCARARVRAIGLGRIAQFAAQACATAAGRPPREGRLYACACKRARRRATKVNPL